MLSRSNIHLHLCYIATHTETQAVWDNLKKLKLETSEGAGLSDWDESEQRDGGYGQIPVGQI